MYYPILISGEKAGELEMRKEGLYTVFEARLPAAEDLTRLWVAGERQSGYLGLMEPKSTERVLVRRLTAAEMRALPKNIEYACTEEPVFEAEEPAGQRDGGGEKQEAPTGAENTDPESEGPVPEATGPPEEAGPQPPPQPEEVVEAEKILETEPHATEELTSAEEPPSEDGLPERLWFSRPDGSLTAFDGRCRLMALPAELRQAPFGVRLLRVEGREYMVFRT